METKKCSKCGEVKAVGEFRLCKRNKSGLQSWCRGCESVDRAKRKAADPKKHQAQQRAYKERNREKVLAEKRAYAKRKYGENPGHFRSKSREWRAANPDKVREMTLDAYWSDPVKFRKRASDWSRAHRDVCTEMSRRYRNKNRERHREVKRRWNSENVERVREGKRASYSRHKVGYIARSAKRRAALLKATPQWADFKAVEAFYEYAALFTQNLGEPWHVDHLVPLQSELVCGLHCEANLRVVPGKQNLSKGNRYWPDMP